MELLALGFNDWFIRRHGRHSPSVSEHLRYIEPSPEELLRQGTPEAFQMGVQLGYWSGEEEGIEEGIRRFRKIPVLPKGRGKMSAVDLFTSPVGTLQF